MQEAFWKQDPNIRDVLRAVDAPRVFIVPFFLSEGYFSSQIIPRELGFGAALANGTRMLRDGNRVVHYTRPVGVHAGLTEVVLSRAQEVTRRAPFPVAPRPVDTTLFLAGHGTERNSNSRQTVEQQVALIRSRGIYRAVHGVFMEEEPRISSVYQLADSRYMVVVPFFIADGLHAQEDIPVLLGESADRVRERLAKGTPAWRNPTERKNKLVWYSDSIGTAPCLQEVILQLVREALESRGADLHCT